MSDEKKKYIVGIKVSYIYEILLEAKNKTEAKRLANEQGVDVAELGEPVNEGVTVVYTDDYKELEEE